MVFLVPLSVESGIVIVIMIPHMSLGLSTFHEDSFWVTKASFTHCSGETNMVLFFFSGQIGVTWQSRLRDRLVVEAC